MVDKCSSPTASLLETLDSERRRKWRQDVTKPVFCCLQIPGVQDTINCQMPAPGTHPATNAQGLPRGDGCSRLELTRTLFLLLEQ